MAKKRSKESYYGNTEEMIRRQRSGLIPGGDRFKKREISEARYNCFWEYNGFKEKQFFFEGYINKRDPKNVPEKELKSEEWLDNWWGELELEDKKLIYRSVMDTFTKEEKTPIFKYMEKCLEKKLAVKKRAKSGRKSFFPFPRVAGIKNKANLLFIIVLYLSLFRVIRCKSIV